ncbi:uncharacterized protein BDV17DRAFT_292711 [Aspergillus undulatus]|uniref:uncharacterized protein n=1 Tax=Aspergillus undulatus TaxID=1810928 RepID=UPI003CCCE3A6
MDLARLVQPLTRQRDTFKKAYPFIFDARGKSILNADNCAVDFAIVDWLVVNGIAAGDIAILTPYRAQHHLHLRAIRQFPHLRATRVETVDSFQGRESGNVVLDLTATEDFRFVSDKNRLCVASAVPFDDLKHEIDIAQGTLPFANYAAAKRLAEDVNIYISTTFAPRFKQCSPNKANRIHGAIHFAKARESSGVQQAKIFAAEHSLWLANSKRWTEASIGHASHLGFTVLGIRHNIGV